MFRLAHAVYGSVHLCLNRQVVVQVFELRAVPACSDGFTGLDAGQYFSGRLFDIACEFHVELRVQDIVLGDAFGVFAHCARYGGSSENLLCRARADYRYFLLRLRTRLS